MKQDEKQQVKQRDASMSKPVSELMKKAAIEKSLSSVSEPVQHKAMPGLAESDLQRKQPETDDKIYILLKDNVSDKNTHIVSYHQNGRIGDIIQGADMEALVKNPPQTMIVMKVDDYKNLLDKGWKKGENFKHELGKQKADLTIGDFDKARTFYADYVRSESRLIGSPKIGQPTWTGKGTVAAPDKKIVSALGTLTFLNTQIHNLQVDKDIQRLTKEQKDIISNAVLFLDAHGMHSKSVTAKDEVTGRDSTYLFKDGTYLGFSEHYDSKDTSKDYSYLYFQDKDKHWTNINVNGNFYKPLDSKRLDEVLGKINDRVESVVKSSLGYESSLGKAVPWAERVSETEINPNSVLKTMDTIHAKRGNAIALFRKGDYYEAYGKDAVKMSNRLGLTLTHLNNPDGLEMVRVPEKALDTYIPKLLHAGERVAMVDTPLSQAVEESMQSKTKETKIINMDEVGNSSHAKDQKNEQYDVYLIHGGVAEVILQSLDSKEAAEHHIKTFQPWYDKMNKGELWAVPRAGLTVNVDNTPIRWDKYILNQIGQSRTDLHDGKITAVKEFARMADISHKAYDSRVSLLYPTAVKHLYDYMQFELHPKVNVELAEEGKKLIGKTFVDNGEDVKIKGVRPAAETGLYHSVFVTDKGQYNIWSIMQQLKEGKLQLKGVEQNNTESAKLAKDSEKQSNNTTMAKTKKQVKQETASAVESKTGKQEKTASEKVNQPQEKADKVKPELKTTKEDRDAFTAAVVSAGGKNNHEPLTVKLPETPGFTVKNAKGNSETLDSMQVLRGRVTFTNTNGDKLQLTTLSNEALKDLKPLVEPLAKDARQKKEVHEKVEDNNAVKTATAEQREQFVKDIKTIMGDTKSVALPNFGTKEGVVASLGNEGVSIKRVTQFDDNISFTATIPGKDDKELMYIHPKDIRPEFYDILKNDVSKAMQPQYVTEYGGKVTNAVVFPAKDDSSKQIFFARIDGKPLHPKVVNSDDAERFRNGELTVKDMMEKYYPTKIAKQLSKEEFNDMKLSDGRELTKFRVYKQDNPAKEHYKEYMMYAELGDKHLHAVPMTHAQLDAYFDRTQSKAMLAEKAFGEDLHLKSAYEKYVLPENVKEVVIRKDANRDYMISATLDDGRKTGEKKLTGNDIYAFFKSKTATKEQLGAKYLKDEISNVAKRPMEVERHQGLKR